MISDLHCTKASSVNQILSIGWVSFFFFFLSFLLFPCFFFLFPLFYFFNCAAALGLEALPHDTRLTPMEAIGIDAVCPFSLFFFFFCISNDRLF